MKTKITKPKMPKPPHHAAVKPRLRTRHLSSTGKSAYAGSGGANALPAFPSDPGGAAFPAPGGAPGGMPDPGAGGPDSSPLAGAAGGPPGM